MCASPDRVGPEWTFSVASTRRRLPGLDLVKTFISGLLEWKVDLLQGFGNVVPCKLVPLLFFFFFFFFNVYMISFWKRGKDIYFQTACLFFVSGLSVLLKTCQGEFQVNYLLCKKYSSCTVSGDHT